MSEKQIPTGSLSSGLLISSVRRVHGRANLLLSSGEILAMPRAMLKERPYRGGMPFDRDAHQAWIRERAYPFAMDKAVSLLAARARTEAEIADALRRNAYPERVIARVMQRLHEAGYINDADFAQRWTASRTSKGLGARRIRMELRSKGLESNAIDKALSSMEDSDVYNGALAAARKAARGKDLSLTADRQKIMAALARRGFDYALARKALDALREETLT